MILPTPDDIDDYLRFGQRLANAAGEKTLAYFGQRPSVTLKDDRSPVTSADKAAEATMRTLIERYYPSHGIIGEEFGISDNDSQLIWVLDPIDGTRSFISGCPLYTTLIALTYDNQPIIGIIDTPALKQRWVAVNIPTWKQVWYNDSPCQVKSVHELTHAFSTTTTLGRGNTNEDDRLRQLYQSSSQSRLGGDAFSYGCLASGFVDIVADYGMQIYDYLALSPVIEAAGGVISNWQNQPLTLKSGQQTVLAAASKPLHRLALNILSNE